MAPQTFCNKWGGKSVATFICIPIQFACRDAVVLFVRSLFIRFVTECTCNTYIARPLSIIDPYCTWLICHPAPAMHRCVFAWMSEIDVTCLRSCFAAHGAGTGCERCNVRRQVGECVWSLGGWCGSWIYTVWVSTSHRTHPPLGKVGAGRGTGAALTCGKHVMSVCVAEMPTAGWPPCKAD